VIDSGFGLSPKTGEVDIMYKILCGASLQNRIWCKCDEAP
jgi:hypothetical protein